VELYQQARVKGGKAYEPLTPVRDLPCWPSEPDWVQLVDEGGGCERDLESPGPDPPRIGPPVRLRAGVDFDRVVFGLSLGSVPSVCRELLEQCGEWRRMVKEVGTVATQALQVWLTASTADLGGDATSPIVAGFVEPFDTWADMSHLLDAENWPSGRRPASIHYFCNVLPDRWEAPTDGEGDPLAKAKASVLQNAATFLSEEVDQFLPGAVESYPREFRWDLLASSSPRNGRARLESQHLRANVAASERYVQSLPGTERYRLAPGESGYNNLVLAGDWTNCGFNAGCVEAATMAGLLAARAIIGSSADTVIGHGHP